MERSADPIDMASQLEEQQTEQAQLARQRAVEAEDKKARDEAIDRGFDGEHCVECEDDLPAVRIAYGKVRCTPCQVEHDSLKKRRLR